MNHAIITHTLQLDENTFSVMASSARAGDSSIMVTDAECSHDEETGHRIAARRLIGELGLPTIFGWHAAKLGPRKLVWVMTDKAPEACL
jgi:hypothetical protein